MFKRKNEMVELKKRKNILIVIGCVFLLYILLCGNITNASSDLKVDTVISGIGNNGGFSCLALDSNDRPHICYYDDSNQAVGYVHFDGNSWIFKLVDYVGYDASLPSMELDSNDYPHIVYRNENYLKYAYYDGEWHTETITKTSTVNSGYCSIILDETDYPHIIYNLYDYHDYYLKYAYYNGNDWIFENISVGYTIIPALGLTEENHPHTVYSSLPEGSSNISSAQITHSYYDGKDWDSEIIPTNDIGMFFSLDLDNNDYPHFVYGTHSEESYDYADDLKYAYYDGKNWNIEIIESDGLVGILPSLSLDKNDHPHISYTKHFSTSIQNELKYAYYDGESWIIESLMGDLGRYGGLSSIVLDKNDNPHFSFNNAEEKTLNYAHFLEQNSIASTKNDGLLSVLNVYINQINDIELLSTYDVLSIIFLISAIYLILSKKKKKTFNSIDTSIKSTDNDFEFKDNIPKEDLNNSNFDCKNNGKALYDFLKIMYEDKKATDEKYIYKKMKINENEFADLVAKLEENGFFKFCSDEEGEITDKGIEYLEKKDAELKLNTFKQKISQWEKEGYQIKNLENMLENNEKLLKLNKLY